MSAARKIQTLVSKPLGSTIVALVGVAGVLLLSRLLDMNLRSLSVLGFIIFLVALMIALVVMNLAAVDTDGENVATLLTPDHQAQPLVQRWVIRARWYRYVGGSAGLVFAVAWPGHFVLFGMVGIMAGAVLSESARVGRSVEGPRAADLTRRSLAQYSDRRQQYMLYGLAGFGVITAVLALLGGRRGWLLVGSLAVLSLVAVVIAAQWRIVLRGRPALPESLRHADDVLRYLACTRSMAVPAIALGFALLAETFGAWAGPEGSSDWASLFEVVFYMLALGVWWRNRRLGLGRLDGLDVDGVSAGAAGQSVGQARISPIR